jgi:hypothetical protein
MIQKCRSVHAPTIAPVVALLALTCPGVAQAQRADETAERVTFAPGAASATLQGALDGTTQHHEYLLRVRAGQRMRVRLRGDAAQWVEVFAPGSPGTASGSWLLGDACAGEDWEGRLLDSGDHRIRVSRGADLASRYAVSVTVANDLSALPAIEPTPGTYVRADGSRVELRRTAAGLGFRLEARARRPALRRATSVATGDTQGVLRREGDVVAWRSGACALEVRSGAGRVYVRQVGTARACGFSANVSADGAYVRTNTARRDGASHVRDDRARRPRG